MTNEGLVATLAQRTSLVEDLRLRARSLEWMRLVGYLVLGVLFLVSLAGGAVGSVWLLGNFVTKNLWVVFLAMLATIVLVFVAFIKAFKAFTRWRADAHPRYVEGFREQVIVPTLLELLPGCAVTAEGNVDNATYEASRLFLPIRLGLRESSTFEARYGIAGRCDGAPFRASILKVQKHSVSSGASSGYKHGRQVTTTYFMGLFVHVERPVELPGTVRLFDALVYEGHDGDRWTFVRSGNIVRARSGNDDFDRDGMVALDEEQVQVPQIPAATFRAWREIRSLVGLPTFVSLNATGIYLAVPVPASPVLPMEERLNTANRPDQLAADVELVQRVVRGAEILRRAFS